MVVLGLGNDQLRIGKVLRAPGHQPGDMVGMHMGQDDRGHVLGRIAGGGQ